MNGKNQNPLVNIGGVYIISKQEVLGVFDLDAANTGTDTKRFLSASEKSRRTVITGNELPKSFVLVANGKKELVYITTLSSATV